MNTRLLVADSDPSLADIYCRFFTSHGYDVDTASDGLACLDKLYGTDVLILDLSLPWGGGDGVLEHMQDDPLMPDIPVVLVASEKSRDELATLLIPPVIECLQKPFQLATLLEAIRAAEALEAPTV